jgi:septum site-determining protein MinD
LDIQVNNKEEIMGVVYAITSGKGGVGKTTTVANISTGLAMKGYSVAVVDGDIGLRNLDLVMGLENRIVYDLVDVIEGRATLKQALIKDKKLKGKLQLLPASQTKDKNAVTPEQMTKLSEELKKDFDFVFVDSPAGIEQGFRNAVAGADEVIIVTNPELSAIRDADRVVGLLDAYGKKAPKLAINRIRPDMVRRGEMIQVEEIIEALEVELLGIIPDDQAVIISTNKGEAVIREEGSKAAKAYDSIVRRIIGEEVPLLDLEEKNSFAAKLFTYLERKGMK